MFSEKKRAHQIAYAQNFLHNSKLVKSLLATIDFSPSKTIVEIGPGKGIITKELIKKADNVIAVEKDTKLANELQQQFKKETKLTLINGDILSDVKIPNHPYSVFANPPFNISSKIVKFFLFQQQAPEQMYLFLQKEAAQRFSGIPHEYELSITTKPWFEYIITTEFTPEDFSPQPNVDVVLLKMTKKSEPLLMESEKEEYKKFVHFVFARQKANAQKAFEPLITFNQWKHLARDLQFDKKVTIKELSLKQWIKLYTFCKTTITKEKQALYN